MDRIQVQILSLETLHLSAAAGSLYRWSVGEGAEREKVCCTSSLFPLSPVCFFTPPKPLPPLCSRAFFFHSAARIPSLDLIFESARDDVAKIRMVSVVTNTTLAIVCSNVGSQVPHLQSLYRRCFHRVHLRTPCTPQTIVCTLTCVCVCALYKSIIHLQAVFIY